MRTKTIKIFKYSELSDDAKEKARDWYRSGPGAEYNWSGETADTLKAFVKALPLTLQDYSYGERGRDYFRYEVNDDNLSEIKGLRLRTWFINNFWNELEKGKYQSTAGTYDVAGKYQYKKRHSKVQKEVDCPFTGFCTDIDIIEPIRALIFKFSPVRDSEKTFREIVDDCFSSFSDAVVADIEGQNEDDAIAEAIEINEYEFTEDGEIA